MFARIGSHVDPQLHNLPVYTNNYRTSKIILCWLYYVLHKLQRLAKT